MTYEEHNQSDVDGLREALFGRSVVAVKMADEDDQRVVGDKYGPRVQGEVRLDDGTVLLLAGNEGGCACSAGDYFLTHLADMPINGITNVEVEEHPDDEDKPCEKCGKQWCYEHENQGYYRIFVLAQDDRIKLAEFEGSDGNGYYGTGFWFSVIKPEAS